MRLKKIVMSTGWDDVKIHIMRHYQKPKKNVKGYRKVFKELKFLTPIHDDEMKIVIKKEEDYHSVYGKLKDDLSWGLEYVLWERWLGMKVSKKTLMEYSYEEIVAHCLYEMTFMGFKQKQIKRALDKMNSECIL